MSPLLTVSAIFAVLFLAAIIARFPYAALFWGSLAVGVGLVAAKNAPVFAQAKGGVGTDA